jgi:hypothetical protein
VVPNQSLPDLSCIKRETLRFPKFLETVGSPFSFGSSFLIGVLQAVPKSIMVRKVNNGIGKKYIFIVRVVFYILFSIVGLGVALQ